MTVSGWNLKYNLIVRKFKYNKEDDLKSARYLDLILKKQSTDIELNRMIHGKAIFVIGAGPSLTSSIPILKKYRNTIKICADTALSLLLKNKIKPEIVVTDLDGDLESLRKIAKTSMIVVHAHADNLNKLEFAKRMKKCVGTTQTKEIGKIRNFGGFTDGDRCVFLASHFKADKIFLFGMDFGTHIGKHSNTKKAERGIKIKKLKLGKMLLEWLASKTNSELFTLSRPIKGFKKIASKDLEHYISS